MIDPVRTLDLRGVACPLNYVKTRVALDRIEPGQCIEVWVDSGEPEDNLPRSCEEDGFAVLEVFRGDDGCVRVTVQR